MKQGLLKKLGLACLGFAMAFSASVAIAGANTKTNETYADSSFNTTYSYDGIASETWSLTNRTDKSSYWLVPASGTKSIATFPNVFKDITPTSNVIVTINHATFGSGTNPSATTFTLCSDSEGTKTVKSTTSGTFATNDNYKDAVYTIAKGDAINLVDNLYLKITKPGKQIRFKYVTISFSYVTGKKTLSSIAVSGSMTKTTYNSLDPEFDPSGLVVTGTYSDASTDDLTSSASFTFNPAAPSVGLTSVSVTATVGTLTSEPYKQNVTVTKSDLLILTISDWKESTTETKTPNGFVGYKGSSNNTYSNPTRVYSGDVITITAYNDAKIKKIVINKASDYSYPSTAKFDNVATTLTNGVAESTTGATKFTVTNNSQWRFNSIEVYYAPPKSAEDIFAENFLNNITCDGGTTAPSTTKWGEMETAFNELTTTQKDTFKNASASASGTSVEQCVARYDFIIGKYSVTNYSNFMSRTVAASNHIYSMNTTENNSIVVIAIVSVISLSGLAALIFIKKRKHN